MAGVYTVTQINSYIKNMFRQDFVLNHVFVKGEISNCKYHTSGHIYFTLKDADASLSVIMFANQAAGLSFRLKDGMSVIVSGRIDVFDAAGKYQLYANKVQQEGIGELYQKYELDENYEWFWSITKIQAQALAEGKRVIAIRKHNDMIYHFGGKSGKAFRCAKGMNEKKEIICSWFEGHHVEILEQIEDDIFE